MKKTTKKPVVSQKFSTRKFNFFPIIGLLVLILAIYSYYRFGVVAMVNGKPISRFSYYRNLEKLDQKQTINQMANEALVYQEATKKGIKIDQSIIDTQIATIEAQVKAQGETLEEALKAESMTKADLESQIRLQKIVEQLANISSVSITQAQVDEYLTKNKSSLPSTYTKEQLQTLAKEQLTTDAENEIINTWFTELQKAAKIVIR